MTRNSAQVRSARRARNTGGAVQALSPAVAADPWNAAIDEDRALDLAEFPGALLLRVANVVHAQSTARYARAYGLAVAEWRILGRLHVSSPMQLSTLCRVSYLDKAQVTRVVSSLKERGLVRVLPDRSHGNRRIVEITPDGDTLAETVFPEALDEQHRLLRMLTADERRTTYAVLTKILEAYGAELPLPAENYREPAP